MKTSCPPTENLNETPELGHEGSTYVIFNLQERESVLH